MLFCVESGRDVSKGSFRRGILIRVHAGADADSGEIRAALEDDFHHIRLTLTFKQSVVTAVSAVFPRHPFATCPGASEPLRDLTGLPLSTIASSVTRWTNPVSQCTHMLDLAGLAVAAGARGDTAVDYEAEVSHRVEGRARARLWRNGRAVMDWELEGLTITKPAPFADRPLGQGFARWALGAQDVVDPEAALVLRRCAVISRGRGLDFKLPATAVPRGRCFTEQPERAAAATRIVESTIDFSSRGDSLCSGDIAWLNGVDEVLIQE